MAIPFVLCANWKMNKNPEEVRSYLRQITRLFPSDEQDKIVFFAPAFTLSVLSEECHSTSFGWGAQNCHFEDKGAFTGENSPMVLKHMGATHCLVGHSERRQLFFENDQFVQKKVKALIKNTLQPVICVGENKVEREKGESFSVVEKQLAGILKQIDFPDSVCIAYEPVWAIGSHQPASPHQIYEMRKHIQKMCESFGKKLCFLYGGSVNRDNIKELSQIAGVNGFLVGGASLDPHNFFNLYRSLI